MLSPIRNYQVLPAARASEGLGAPLLTLVGDNLLKLLSSTTIDATFHSSNEFIRHMSNQLLSAVEVHGSRAQELGGLVLPLEIEPEVALWKPGDVH